MNTSPLFAPSPLGSTKSKINVAHWPTVMDNFDKGNFNDVLSSLLYYVNPEISEKYWNKNDNSYLIPHGSVVVKIKQDAENIIIEAPFLSIAKSAKIPLMRQVAQLNFHPLTITKIVLDDNDNLCFSYKGPIELCDPYKLYDILREICINADRYDDEFITKFKAEWLQEPRIERYGNASLDEAWTKIQEFIAEAFQYIEYFESKRIFDFLYDVYKSTFTKIDYYIAPQGFLRSEFEKQITDLDGNFPYDERMHKAKEFLTKLKNFDKQKFFEDIYKADVFIPYKYISNIENVRKNFEGAHNTAIDEISKRSFMGAFYTLYCSFLRLFYYNYVNSELSDLVTKALVESSQKSWEEAANILLKAMDTIMKENIYENYLNSYQAKN